MELPDVCVCGHVNLVDYGKLERRPLSGLYTASGYECRQCKTWKPCYYSTRLLDEELSKLEKLSPNHPSFAFRLAKAFRRASAIQVQAIALLELAR